jgi:hypothetical protein
LEEKLSVKIQFRPHHFLCTLCFRGSGYSPYFIKNYQEIVTLLNSDQGNEMQIEVVGKTDSICSACPHRTELNHCHDEVKTRVLDNAHAQALGLKNGDSLTWNEAKNLIAEKIDLEKFHEICATCSWKSLGICEEILKVSPAIKD